MIVNMAVLPPIPRLSVSTAVRAKAGFFRIVLSAYCMSRQAVSRNPTLFILGDNIYRARDFEPRITRITRMGAQSHCIPVRIRIQRAHPRNSRNPRLKILSPIYIIPKYEQPRISRNRLAGHGICAENDAKESRLCSDCSAYAESWNRWQHSHVYDHPFGPAEAARVPGSRPAGTDIGWLNDRAL